MCECNCGLQEACGPPALGGELECARQKVSFLFPGCALVETAET